MKQFVSQSELTLITEYRKPPGRLTLYVTGFLAPSRCPAQMLEQRDLYFSSVRQLRVFTMSKLKSVFTSMVQAEMSTRCSVVRSGKSAVSSCADG